MEVGGEKRKRGRPKKEPLPPYIFTKSVGKLTPTEREKKKAELLAYRVELLKKAEEAKAHDPFWFFEPSDGSISDDRREFLKQYLKEEDIPQKIDSQLDALLSDSPIIGVFGGNQSGKSTICGIKRYIQTTGEVPLALEGIYPKERLRVDFSRTMKIRVVGVDHKTMLNTLIPTYQKWAPRDYLKNGSWSDSFSSTQNTLFLYKKGISHPIASFEFMTNQQDVESFQGPPLDGLNYDEEPKQAVHKENLMRFTTAEKVDIMFGMTPTNGLTWVYDLFQMDDMGGERIESFKLASVTNKKANLSSLRQILDEVKDNYEELKMRLLGSFVSLSGLVYGNLFNRGIHVIEPFFERLSPVEKRDYLVVCGLDPHLVTPTAMVFLLIDRENNYYVDRCYFRDKDTEVVKQDFWDIVKAHGYRIGWSVTDTSSNSSITAFGGRNIFRELRTGVKAIPSLRTSEKYDGSIKAGVDEMKKLLKVGEKGKPRLFVVNRPDNKALIQSFRTLERDTYADEDKNGPKDRIKEGKHHLHSALRFIFQFHCNWYPAQDVTPQPEYFDEAVAW